MTFQELVEYGEYLTAKRAYELEELKRDNRRLRLLKNISRERAVNSPMNARVSVRVMVEETLPDFGDREFTRAEVRRAVLEKWPEHDAKIRMGIDTVLALFVQCGELVRYGDTLRRVLEEANVCAGSIES